MGFCVESEGSTLVFCLINFVGELLAVIGNNQPDQFPYIILLGHSFNDGSRRFRIADYGTVLVLTGIVRNISYK